MTPSGRSRRRPTRPQLLVLALALVTTVTVGTGLVLQANLGGNRPSGQAGPGSSAAASTATPTTGATGQPAQTDWEAVELGDIPGVATIEAAEKDAAGVAPGSTFKLISRTDEPAEAIAARLTASPETTFAVAPSSDGRSATLTPTARLVKGRTYRLGLAASDGTVQGAWAFHVRGPVGIASTTPGDRSTGVPVQVGIEITFDQDDVADMTDHFSISPTVEGRFERHGRTQVFVPNALTPATLYTVTIRKGLERSGTELVLEQDVVVRFETQGPNQPGATRIQFGRDVVEAGLGERPVLGVNAITPGSDDVSPANLPKTADVVVYQFPSLDTAAKRLADFLAAPRWTEYSDPRMPTGDLPKVLTFEAGLTPLVNQALVLPFPESLSPGWYVVELPGPRPSQAFLQVTPISAWVAVLSDRTVVWVNDVSSGQPVKGAAVAVEGGPAVGTSAADGLVNAPTPGAIVPPAASDPDDEAPAPSPILRVTAPSGAVVLVPFGVAGYGDSYRGEWYEKSAPADETYWSILFTDRDSYRSNDTIHAWGYLRGRDDGVVPDTVDLELVPSGTSAGQPPIAHVTVHPTKTGAFSADLALHGLDNESYELHAVVDGRVVVGRWIGVTVIVKPPYRIGLVPDVTAVLSGSRVTWTATAEFFDGTPVPALDIRFSGSAVDPAKTRATDAAGLARLTTVERNTGSGESYDSAYMSATPRTEEAAEIQANGYVVVFPSSIDVDASGTIADGRLRIDGIVNTVDLAKARRAIDAGTFDGEADGRPVARQRINVRVTELVPHRRTVGNDYDFVEKVVRPRYEYSTERREIHNGTLTSDRDGRIRATFPVPNAKHQYEVALEVQDRAGRVARGTVYVSSSLDTSSDQAVTFHETDGRLAGDREYRVGERVVWQMADNDGRFPSGGRDRYLYIVAQRGLTGVAVTDSATFRHTFAAKDAPGIFIIGVRFTGSSYAPKAASWANFDRSQRALKVQVRSDKARYRPGETATLSVRTTDAAGHPVAASVLFQAVDEKLYAMGLASIPRPLDELYERVDSGIVRLTATHQTPSQSGPEGEGGDTTGGGGPRDDFVDTLLFRMIQTDAAGRARTTVKLSDDLTSWHIVAGALTADLRAGLDEHSIAVGLPFFVEVTAADSYLVGDHPRITIRAFGERLRKGDPVEFDVAAFGAAPVRLKAKAFEPVRFTLPALSVGRRSITVSGRAPTRKTSGGTALGDTITRSFDVITSRSTTTASGYGTVGGTIPTVPGSTGLTTYTFVDGGRGAVLPLLLSMAAPGGMRTDRLAAQSIARQLLVDEFGRAPGSLPDLDIDEMRYPIGQEAYVDDQADVTPGIGLFPWSSPDPWLTARVAITAPHAVQADLADLLHAIRAKDSTKRDLAIAALAGLASVGEPVLSDLQTAYRQSELTVTERLYLALGFAAAGDDATAIAIERDLLSQHGERLGRWVRLRMGGDRAATGTATALLAVVAAGIGDPLGADMAEYLQANPDADSLHELELVAYAGRMLERATAGAGSFAYTVDGRRTVVALKPGETYSVTLTETQRASLRLEALGGTVAVVASGRAITDVADLTPSPDLTLVRKGPAGAVATDAIITVDLTATFKAGAPDGCYLVVEHAPSGLAPTFGGDPDEGDGGPATRIAWPTSIVGQEVRFCADNVPEQNGTVHLRYRARVVNAGRFLWEPAVMQLPEAPALLAVTRSEMVEIRPR